MRERRGSGRRYLIRFVIVMIAYAVLLVLGLTLTQLLPDDSPWRYLTVLLPLPAVIGIAWALWRYVIEADELQSRILLEALAIAVAGAAICSFAYGMLQTVGAPTISWVWVTPLILLWFGIGSIVSGWRYR